MAKAQVMAKSNLDDTAGAPTGATIATGAAAKAAQGAMGPGKFAEFALRTEAALRARMPWRRPQVKGGRVTTEDAVRVKAGEMLLAYFAEAERPRGKPDPPSVRLAKARRPYTVARMAGDATKVEQINALAKAGGGGRSPRASSGKAVVVSPSVIVAKRGKGKVAAVLSGLGGDTPKAK
jgi:hypothetical protein